MKLIWDDRRKSKRFLNRITKKLGHRGLEIHPFPVAERGVNYDVFVFLWRSHWIERGLEHIKDIPLGLTRQEVEEADGDPRRCADLVIRQAQYGWDGMQKRAA